MKKEANARFVKATLLILIFVFLIAIILNLFVFPSQVYLQPAGCVDNDNDGYGSGGGSGIANGCRNDGEDCDDNNANVNPGAIEDLSLLNSCIDNLDNNCDGEVDFGENLLYQTSIHGDANCPVGINNLYFYTDPLQQTIKSCANNVLNVICESTMSYIYGVVAKIDNLDCFFEGWGGVGFYSGLESKWKFFSCTTGSVTGVRQEVKCTVDETKTYQSGGDKSSLVEIVAPTQEECGDFFDNDCDGRADCRDSDCQSNVRCAGIPVCGNNRAETGEQCGEPGLNCLAGQSCNVNNCRCESGAISGSSSGSSGGGSSGGGDGSGGGGNSLGAGGSGGVGSSGGADLGNQEQDSRDGGEILGVKSNNLLMGILIIPFVAAILIIVYFIVKHVRGNKTEGLKIEGNSVKSLNGQSL